MITLLCATRNRHKVRELRQLLAGVPVKLVSLDRFPSIPPVHENGRTFRENAIKKAVAVSRRTILLVLAEDSGLAVRALGGRPGVRSARFAGPAQKDEANNAKLLRLMVNVPASERQARFICCLALAAGGRLIRTFQAECAGSIAVRPVGRHGFGYDPLFIPRGYNRTMAQWGARAKHRISHRAAAVGKFRRWLGAQLKTAA